MVRLTIWQNIRTSWRRLHCPSPLSGNMFIYFIVFRLDCPAMFSFRVWGGKFKSSVNRAGPQPANDPRPAQKRNDDDILAVQLTNNRLPTDALVYTVSADRGKSVVGPVAAELPASTLMSSRVTRIVIILSPALRQKRPRLTGLTTPEVEPFQMWDLVVEQGCMMQTCRNSKNHGFWF